MLKRSVEKGKWNSTGVGRMEVQCQGGRAVSGEHWRQQAQLQPLRSQCWLCSG
jgi:hypothetical protein